MTILTEIIIFKNERDTKEIFVRYAKTQLIIE